MRVFNFAPGPATLPLEVLEQVRDELIDWQGGGMSVMEVSHRGKPFVAMVRQAEADIRQLMGIPDNYKVLFLQGGATGQFAGIPMNIARPDATVDYVNTGSWSKKAIGEAKLYCAKVNVAADAKADGYNSVPDPSQWNRTPGAAYLHYTPNETIGGVAYPFIPDAGNVPLVADYSSSIMSEPLDVSKFGVIYAGAQKNIGIAGMCVVIVRDDLLDRARPDVPFVWNWKVMAEDGSLGNTPPAFAVYVAGLVFQWALRQGGIAAIGEINRRKAAKLYAAIDATGFYRNPVAKHCRSIMNVPFTLKDPALDKPFLEGAAKASLVNLQGHRSVGGMRASIYNAMPEAGVDALIAYMQEFERRHG
ncbi:MAG: 3-phosphoserine/phosphohydroxythreonine transaminase [Steroidobacteraceae bacterium]